MGEIEDLELQLKRAQVALLALQAKECDSVQRHRAAIEAELADTQRHNRERERIDQERLDAYKAEVEHCHAHRGAAEELAVRHAVALERIADTLDKIAGK